MAYKAYCVKCKTKVDVVDPEISEIETKRGSKRAVKGVCGTCGTKVCVFIK